MKKRILSLLLCLVMLFSLMPTSAFAEELPEQPEERAVQLESAAAIPEEATPESAGQSEEVTEPEAEEADIIVIEGSIDAAENPNIAEGTNWYIDAAGCLHITGHISRVDGAIPWNEYKEQIITVETVYGASVESCADLFRGCSNLVSADLSHMASINVPAPISPTAQL